MSFKLPLILTTITTVVLLGCGGSAAIAPSWARVGPGNNLLQYGGKRGITADLPDNWMMIENQSTLMLTRHSAPLDVVLIRRRELPAMLSGTELTVNRQTQFYELAQIVIHNLRATPGVFDLVISEVAYHQIDGRDGFRILGAYRLESGVVRRCLVYGFIHDGDKDSHYTEIGLYALEDYYYDAVVDDFISMVGSVKAYARTDAGYVAR